MTKWRDIPGWEGFYAVSDDGQVKSLERSVSGRPGVMINKRERLMKQWPTSDGYAQVFLSRGNRRKTVRVHRLVLLAFVGPCPDGMEGCHNDGDKTNNRVENLRWATRSENTYDKVRHGAHPFARRTHCPQGHPYDDTNTYIAPRGGRHCIACKNEKKRARRAALRSAA